MNIVLSDSDSSEDDEREGRKEDSGEDSQEDSKQDSPPDAPLDSLGDEDSEGQGSKRKRQIDREKGLSPRKKKGKTKGIDLDPSRTFRKPSQQKSGKSERTGISIHKLEGNM